MSINKILRKTENRLQGRILVYEKDIKFRQMFMALDTMQNAHVHSEIFQRCEWDKNEFRMPFLEGFYQKVPAPEFAKYMAENCSGFFNPEKNEIKAEGYVGKASMRDYFTINANDLKGIVIVDTALPEIENSCSSFSRKASPRTLKG
jgi:hypothetical protein